MELVLDVLPRIYASLDLSSWILFIALFSLMVRICMLPLSWKSFYKTRRLTQVSGELMALHQAHKNDPDGYERAFRLFKKQSGTSVPGVMGMFFSNMFILVFAGFLVFRISPHIQGVTELGARLDLNALSGGWPSIIVMIIMVIVMLILGVVSVYGGDKRAREYSTKVKLLIIFAPALLQLAVSTALPLYFNIYILVAISFGILQSIAFNRKWANYPSINLDRKALGLEGGSHV